MFEAAIEVAKNNSGKSTLTAKETIRQIAESRSETDGNRIGIADVVNFLALRWGVRRVLDIGDYDGERINATAKAIKAGGGRYFLVYEERSVYN